MPILLGLHVKPLPPMRDARQIVIDALAAILGGVELQDGHVRGLVEFAHPNGQNRLCEAFAVMAHLAADRNPNAMKEVFEAKRLDDKAKAKNAARSRDRKLQMVDGIMDAINAERDHVRACGLVFAVSDIRPIIEKALS